MVNSVVPEVRKALQARVSTWNTVVDFDIIKLITSKEISIHVRPTGPGAEFWGYVSRGVPGHPIFPRREWSTPGTFRGVGWGHFKRKAALRLHHYRPATAPGNVYGQAIWRRFSNFRPYVPWWTGIRPRLFEENVAEDLRQWYHREMENIVRRGVTAAIREGKVNP